MSTKLTRLWRDKPTVAIAEGDLTGEVRAYGEVSSDLVTTEKALRKIKRVQGVIHVAYEAGPTGFVLYRPWPRPSRRRGPAGHRPGPRRAASRPKTQSASAVPICRRHS